MLRPRRRAILSCLCLGLSGSAALAQQNDPFGLIDGSIVFIDSAPDSDARCAAVNTFNADFFIRNCDRRLILTTGDDRETPYVVETDYSVFRSSDGAPAGIIRFATDNDNNRQVFWLTDDGLVLRYNFNTDGLDVATVMGNDGEEISLRPINVSQTECDPLTTFDGGNELLCPRVCGAGGGAATLTAALSLGLMGFGRRRRRRPV